MDKRSFLKTVVKGGCVFGAGVASGIVSGVLQPVLDTGEKILTPEEYPEVFGRGIDDFMERYEITDRKKAEELYALVVVEAGVHGFGGGIVGPLYCMATNTTTLPHFGKGGVVRGLFNIAASYWVGNGAARAAHDVAETKGTTFFISYEMLVDDYGLKPRKAIILCLECKGDYYKHAGAGAAGSSVAYQAVHWLGQGLKAFSNRKKKVAAKDSGEGKIVDVAFEKIFDDFQGTSEQLAILEKPSTIEME